MPIIEMKRTIVLGALNNTVLAAAGGVLALLQSVLVIRLLSPRQMGEFAVAAAFASTLEFISDFGIGDRLVQQDNLSVRDSYRLAITVHILAALPLWAVIFWAAPFISEFYALPGLSTLIRFMSFQAFAGVGRLPLFLLYRDLKYFEHRILLLVGKVTAFITTVLLALNGYGAWSLAIGGLAGLVATCIPAWYLTALSPGWRFHMAEVRQLFSFSWPVWLSRVTLILVEQGTVLVVALLLSIQELGQYRSTMQLSHFALLIEVIFAQTIYPVLCRAKASPSELSAIVSSSGRAAMLFLAGAGVGLVVFAEQIVRLLLGSKWVGAELFLQAHGVALLFGALAFNWEAVFRALGDTKPIFRVSVIYGASFFLTLCPLTYLYGKRGTAAGLVTVNLIGFLARNHYFNGLRLGTSMSEIIWRGLLSAIVAVIGVAILRACVGPANSVGPWLTEVAVYLLIYLLTTWRCERNLIRDIREVLMRRNTTITVQ
jgi:O-antigen/teichoic acid export membrane protein